MISAFSTTFRTQPRATKLRVSKVDTSIEELILERRMWRPSGRPPEILKAPTLGEEATTEEATRTTKEAAATITEEVAETIKETITKVTTEVVADTIEAGTAAVVTKREAVDRMAAEVAEVDISSHIITMKREAVSNGADTATTTTAVAKTSIEVAIAMRMAATLIAEEAEVAEEASSISMNKDPLEPHLLEVKGPTEAATREEALTTPSNSGSTPSLRVESQRTPMENN